MMDKLTQAELDKIRFDMYVDCGLNATAAAKQLGCDRTTVKDSVRRHSLRETAITAACDRERDDGRPAVT